MKRIWGTTDASLSPTSLSSLKLKYVLADLKNVKGKILEVGCGAGMFSLAIKEFYPNLSVYGCDIDKQEIEIAKRRKREVKFLEASIYKLPFKNESLDAVVSFDVLEHLEYPKRGVLEIGRVLKKGALMHIYVPCEGDIYTIYGVFKQFGVIPKRKYAGHIQQYELGKLKELIKSCGFEIRSQRFSSHLFMQIVDFSYFILLAVLGRNVSYTIEGFIDNKDRKYPHILKSILILLKNTISIIGYLESSIFYWVPSHGVHISCYKV